MNIYYLPFIAILVTLPWGVAENPGARVLLTQSGMNYVVEKAVPYLKPLLSTLNIPDISGKKIDCHYELNNFKIGNVKFSEPSLTPGESGLTLKVEGIALSGSVDYEYHCPLWIHGSGNADISTSDSSLKISILVNKDETGEPELVPNGCSLDISNLNIKFHGSLSWLANLFKGLIENAIREAANSDACSALSNEIKNQGNSLIKTFPTKMVIDQFMEIDYSLTDNAKYTESYVKVDVKGEFISTKPNAEKPPFSPSSIPELSETGRMVFVVISPYMANTAAFVIQEAGLLQYNVTPNTIHSSIQIPLTTAIFEELIPGFYEKYPDMNITINIFSTKPPILKVDPNAAMLHGSGVIEFAVYDATCDNAIVHAFSLEIEGSVEVKVGLNHTHSGTNITGKVESFDSQISIKDTEIGYINASKLTDLINMIGQQLLVPIVNRYTRVGWPIPTSMDGLELHNLEIRLGEGYILVGSDVSYDPLQKQSLDDDDSASEDLVMKKLRPHVRF